MAIAAENRPGPKGVLAQTAGHLSVNLGAVRRNYRAVSCKIGEDCRAAAVVKANAYGLGAGEVAGALLGEGCRDFFVATLEEALALQDLHAEMRLYVLGGFCPSHGPLYASGQGRIIPVLNSLEEIGHYAVLAQAEQRALPALIHFNTGMNRLGLCPQEQAALWDDMDALDGLEIRGVMSHLACADEPDNPLNEAQRAAFEAIGVRFPGVPKIFSNSAGLCLGRAFHFDMVRTGLLLYGTHPAPHNPDPVKIEPVLSLSIPVIKRFSVDPGETTGYNATYRFDKKSPVATLRIGYADGLFWALGNQGVFYWNGIPCPVRGRVSMDLTVVDLSSVPEDRLPRTGECLELIGPHQSVADLAQAAGTIPYEVLTALGHRFERAYRNL